MPEIRNGRQKYYDLFSHFYDGFIRMHSGRHGNETRNFLVCAARIDSGEQTKILDICCGTGSVVLAFSKKFTDALAIGYDFSTGMLVKAKEKDEDGRIVLVQGDAGRLSFRDDCFYIVCCSHALYELKGAVRTAALMEMRRVVKPEGMVMLMEHEVPQHPMVKVMFKIRMAMMGAADAKEFLKQDLSPYKAIFDDVALSHTPSGKSKLIVCRKNASQSGLS